MNMKKHILPLTYEPKIQAVLDGDCTQTIRPMNPSNLKNPSDLVMFHGWSGKPYRSKWSFRTPYWEITEVIDVCIKPKELVFMSQGYDDVSSDFIARMDGFESYEDMYQQFVKMYGDIFNDPFLHQYFQVICWEYKKYKNLSVKG